MKRLLCLVLALMLCMSALPALAEMTLNPDQWTEPFDYTAEAYCDAAETRLPEMMDSEGEWHVSDAPKGYRVLTFTSEKASDIVVLAGEDDRVLAIGLCEEMSLTDVDALAAQCKAFGMGMAAVVLISRLVEVDGDSQTFDEEKKTIQAELMAFQEAINDLESLLSSGNGEDAGVYKDIEVAGHHMNFAVKISLSDMSMSFTGVYAPITAKPE